MRSRGAHGEFLKPALLALLVLGALLPLGPAAAEPLTCITTGEDCHRQEYCRYNPHDPLRSPIQWFLCGDAPNTVDYFLRGLAP